MAEMTPEEAAAFEKKYRGKPAAPAAPPPPPPPPEQGFFSRFLRGRQQTLDEREKKGGSNY
jgi:hypothetical protein